MSHYVDSPDPIRLETPITARSSLEAPESVNRTVAAKAAQVVPDSNKSPEQTLSEPVLGHRALDGLGAIGGNAIGDGRRFSAIPWPLPAILFQSIFDWCGSVAFDPSKPCPIIVECPWRGCTIALRPCAFRPLIFIDCLSILAALAIW